MNYFNKIEAYSAGTLSAMERSIFEIELTQNIALREELEAYQLAQSLFDFTGANLSEETIINTDATSLFDELINFTASNLSEEQILGIDTTIATESTELADELINFTASNLSEEQILGIDTTIATESTELADELINFTASNLSEEQILGIDTTIATESTELADELINFTASNLSEEQILGIDTTTATESTELADELINFTANNLSEAQILATTSIGAKTSIIRRLQMKTNRTAWAAAASMLFILSMIGTQLYTAPSLGQGSSIVGEMPAPIENSPVKAILTNNTLEEVLAINIPEKAVKKKYSPAKVRVTKKITPSVTNNQLAAVEVDNAEPNMAKTILENPIAMNTVAKEISTSAIIPKGQNTAYQATSSITLTAGFSAPPGTSFMAMTTQEKALQEVNSNSTISEKESVLLKANTSITLKPGFHAKAGADFKAEIGK